MPAREKIWYVVVIAVAICTAMYSLVHLVGHSGHALPTLYGDGMKNAYTYLYQSMHGNGAWFHGMNYPYGDHIVYTDGTPLLSVPLAMLGHTGQTTALAILWWFLAVGYILCIVYLYRILLYFRVAHLPALFFAVLITVCSPQAFRIPGGHYALSYLAVVPMLFFFTLKYHRLRRPIFAMYVFIVGFVAAMLHMYYIALLLLWIGTYLAGYILFSRDTLKGKLRHALPLASVAIVLPVIAKICIALADHVTDRPMEPYGLRDTAVIPSDFLTSLHSPVWEYLHNHELLPVVSRHVRGYEEGYSYLGIVAIIVIVLSLVKNIIDKIRSKPMAAATRYDEDWVIWLFMAISTILFLALMPMLWRMPWLDGHLSFLRQFRTIARFVWICYYILSIYGAVVLYKWCRQFATPGRAWAGYAILVLAVAVWSLEAYGAIGYVRDGTADAKSTYDRCFFTASKDWNGFLRERHLRGDDFQATIAFDFAHVGSEKLWIGEQGTAFAYACVAALQLGLPMINASLSRTSLSQAQSQAKILAGPYADKPLLRDMKTHQPFLMLVYDRVQLGTDERYLLQAVDTIGHFSSCHVYALYPDRLMAVNKQYADNINALLPAVPVGDTCIVNKGTWYADHMDKGSSAEHLFGAGGATPKGRGEHNIATIPLQPAADSQEYEFSAWVLLDRIDYKSPNFDLQMTDSSGKMVAVEYAFGKASVDSHGMWFRVSAFFRPPAGCRLLTVKITDAWGNAYKAMDEILLRPADALIVSKDGAGRVMVNNHLFRSGADGR